MNLYSSASIVTTYAGTSGGRNQFIQQVNCQYSERSAPLVGYIAHPTIYCNAPGGSTLPRVYADVHFIDDVSKTTGAPVVRQDVTQPVLQAWGAYYLACVCNKSEKLGKEASGVTREQRPAKGQQQQ